LKKNEWGFAIVEALLVVAVLLLVSLPLQSHNNNASKATITLTSTSTTDIVATSLTHGLQLRVATNSTELMAGQHLGISIDLVNTLPMENEVPPWDVGSNVSWGFAGFPVAVWPDCIYYLPLEFNVFKGNYTATSLAASDPGVVPENIGCKENESVSQLVFQPESDEVNVTAYYAVDIGPNETNPAANYRMQWRMESNFTVGGYWNATEVYNPFDLASTAVGSNIFTFGYPEVPPLGQTPFSPGAYTLAVSDEWGQVAIIPFTVS
jgi:hypothetical protein